MGPTASDSLEPALLQLLQEVQSLKAQLSASEQQREQERQQFQAELNLLAAQQQQLIESLHNSHSEPSSLLAYLKGQKRHHQDLQQQQEIIRKNQIASVENYDRLGKWLREELPKLTQNSTGERPIWNLFGSFDLLEWGKLILGIVLITGIVSAVQQYLPGGQNERLQVMDDKISIIWSDLRKTQKFLGMPQK
jgi:hypothetical protein